MKKYIVTRFEDKIFFWQHFTRHMNSVYIPSKLCGGVEWRYNLSDIHRRLLIRNSTAAARCSWTTGMSYAFGMSCFLWQSHFAYYAVVMVMPYNAFRAVEHCVMKTKRDGGCCGCCRDISVAVLMCYMVTSHKINTWCNLIIPLIMLYSTS